MDTSNGKLGPFQIEGIIGVGVVFGLVGFAILTHLFNRWVD
jgi:hypothetical protein